MKSEKSTRRLYGEIFQFIKVCTGGNNYYIFNMGIARDNKQVLVSILNVVCLGWNLSCYRICLVWVLWVLFEGCGSYEICHRIWYLDGCSLIGWMRICLRVIPDPRWILSRDKSLGGQSRRYLHIYKYMYLYMNISGYVRIIWIFSRFN